MDDRDGIDARMHRADQARLRPLDTTELGPVRFDPDGYAERVKRAAAILDRVMPTIADITATQARSRAIGAMLEFEKAERERRL